MIINVENSKESKKSKEQFTKVIREKVRMKTSIVCLYMNNRQLEIDFPKEKKMTPLYDH